VDLTRQYNELKLRNQLAHSAQLTRIWFRWWRTARSTSLATSSSRFSDCSRSQCCRHSSTAQRQISLTLSAIS